MAATKYQYANSNWQTLYKIGGAAALLAGLIFRRNISAEILLFTGRSAPGSVADWFALLHNQPLLGMALLSIFDVVDYALLGLMFLAVGIALWQSHKSLASIATVSSLVAIATSFASNNAFSMAALSQQYASATTDAQRSALLAAGQGVLALNNPQTIYQGTGAYVSLLLLALAGLLVSIAMLRSRTFGRASAYVGILASACDLIYCLTFTFAPFLKAYLLATGGLLLMIWHIQIAIKLLQLGKAPSSYSQDVPTAIVGE